METGAEDDNFCSVLTNMPFILLVKGRSETVWEMRLELMEI